MGNIFEMSNVRYLAGAWGEYCKGSVIGVLGVNVERIDNRYQNHFEKSISEYVDLQGLHFTQGKNLNGMELIDDLLRLSEQILIKNNHICEGVQIISAISIENKVHFQFSCMTRESFFAALRIASEIILNLVIRGSDMLNHRDMFKKEVAILNRDSPKGFNTHHLLLGSNKLNIPWFKVYQNIYQIGYGVNSRLFNSSESDETSSISAAILKDKYATQHIMKNNGFPISPFRRIFTVEHGILEARRMGFPIVVKPIDTEGGIGISAGVKNESDCRSALNKAFQYSKNVILEKHFYGKDYRVQIVDGKVQGVISRTAPFVLGDGKNTIINLIKKINRERRDADDDRKYLHPIDVNSETIRALKDSGYHLEMIPDKDEKVTLAYTSNIAIGGIPLQINIGEMHPDNIDLCVDACRLFRIDIAGVDLLIPDIRVSWKSSGAHICEINHKPQMFTTLFEPLLKAKFKNGGGRIPICVVLEENSAGSSKIIEPIWDVIERKYKNPIFISDHNFDSCGVERIDWFSSVRRSLSDTRVDALVVSLRYEDSLKNGWPFEYCNILICTERVSKKTESELNVIKEKGESALQIGKTVNFEGMSKKQIEKILEACIENEKFEESV